jgi:hypothetical protein
MSGCPSSIANPLTTVTANSTPSPWASLIEPDSGPHLPARLTTPSIALKAIVRACLVVAGRRSFHYMKHAETAEELAGLVPGLSKDAAVILLGAVGKVVEDSTNPAGLFHGTMNADELAWIGRALREAFDKLASEAVPDLPEGAIDPRTIPAGLNPRPATYWDAVSLDDSPQVGWPKVTWEGVDYLVPQVEELQLWSELRPDGEFVGTGHQDSWGALLALLPSDPEGMS